MFMMTILYKGLAGEKRHVCARVQGSTELLGKERRWRAGVGERQSKVGW